MRRSPAHLFDLVLGAGGAPDAQLVDGSEEVLGSILLVFQLVQVPTRPWASTF